MAKSREPLRLDVRKTYASFVDGAFVRSDAAASDPVGVGNDAATVARASRSDLRAAIVAARSAHARWSGRSAYERGLQLYRLAELMDARHAEFVERLRADPRVDEADARRETTAAVDRTLWYAGWCDKYAACLSACNPVAGPFFSLVGPEPLGVVGVLVPDTPSLLGLVAAIVPALVSGNTVVAVASETDPRTAVVFAECLGTCALPPGTVNVLTGRRIELAPHLARHAGVDALCAYGLDAPFAAELERLAADDGKRTHFIERASHADFYAPEAQDLAHIARFVSSKTVWHPAAI